MFLLTLSHQQQVQNFLIIPLRYKDGIKLLILTAKYVNVNIILYLNFVIIFYTDGKLHNLVIQFDSCTIFLSVFLVRCASFSCAFKYRIWHQRKHSLSSFLRLTKSFLECWSSIGSGIYELPFVGSYTNVLI